MDEKVEKERLEFKRLLVENPNYFGTSPSIDLKAVKQIQGNTKYEELHCLGFYPELDQLEAIFDVKLSSGYRGGLCSAGSNEYVRFYVDWDGDGDFDDPEEDVGVVSVNVHDIPDAGGRCIDEDKPLSYAVRITLDPKKYGCKKVNLVKVRAILSWETPPLPATPNHPVVWGNVLEKWIQIKPRDYVLGDFLDAIDMSKLEVLPALLDAQATVSKAYSLTPDELKEIYYEEDVPEHRFNLPQLAPLAAQVKLQPELLAKYKLDTKTANLVEAIQAIILGEPETKYEELNCVGLLYDRDTLAATMTVKLKAGYSGGLCTDGSKEHVAFWARVYDRIEQQCVWRYLGTASVNVHDIPEIPEDGLEYAVYLPSDLSEWKESCGEPVVMQIRAVLSWNTLPSTTDPNEEPIWGNIVDTLIQLKPDDPTIPGKQKPYLWSVSEMAVESIAGNPYTTMGSALGDGYANGPSVGGGFSAEESPFGGIAKITGTITNAPNNPSEPQKLKYKVQYKKVGPGTSWQDITNKFRVWLRIDGVPSGHLDQVATGGYYKYQKDLTLPVLVEVQDDVLAQWNTTKAEGDGLYLLRVLLFQSGAQAMPGVPPDHVASKIIKVKVDNTDPIAKISLDAGPCTKFAIGDDFMGKFTATDHHIWRYSIGLLPSTADPPIISPTTETYPLLTSPGKVDETFTVTTTASTTPCGYVIQLHVRDRAIVNNHFPGNHSSASVGLCLLEEEA